MVTRKQAKSITVLLFMSALLLLIPRMAVAGGSPDDAVLGSVLSKRILVDSGSGTKLSPFIASIDVASNINSVRVSDVYPLFAENTVLFYGTDETYANYELGSIDLSLGETTGVYVIVISDDGSNKVHYQVDINRSTTESDASIQKVLNEQLIESGGTGSKGTPFTAGVNISAVETVSSADILTSATGAAVTFYGTDSSYTTPEGGNINLAMGSSTYIYVKITSNDALNNIYYEIRIHRDYAIQEGDFLYTVAGGVAEITGYKGDGEDVTIPGSIGGYSVESIGSRCFDNTFGLRSIKLPATVTYVGWSLSGISGLNSIDVDAGNSAYSSVNGLLLDKTGSALIACPAGLANVNIPTSVTDIGDFAFSSCSFLTGIDLPQGVTSIGYRAFSNCTSLENVIIPQGVVSMNENAFSNCYQLMGITFDSAVTNIYDSYSTIYPTANIIGYNPSTAQDYAFRYDRSFELKTLDTTAIEDFVTRFYEQCLKRQPDQTGLDYWVDILLSGEQTGADVAQGFVFSNEFTGLGVSNEEYLDVLYSAFFNREPDSGGYTYWLGQLDGGTSRLVVLAGFVNANEFGDLCDDYGITRGSIETSDEQIAAFVTRFYEECLGRQPDQSGLDYWVDSLDDGASTGADVAYGFVYSNEFQASVMTDEEYLEVLFTAFFNREADSGGLTYWLGEMGIGTSRLEVLAGFVNSNEFANLCSEYGIDAGEIDV